MLARALLLCAALALRAAANPCCSNPCQNQGVCMSVGFDQYTCDCTRTGFYGENCSTPEFMTRIKLLLKPTPNTVHYILTHFKGVWDIVNSIPFLRNAIMKYVLTWKKELPDSEVILDKFMIRREFIPDPQGTNLMFAFFAQHFTHQFFKTDHKRGPAFTKGLGHGVIDGEVYPPTVKDTQAEMIYPPHVPEHLRFAVGQEVFGLVPGLMMYATIWLREHNRVCDVLKQEHPEWDDERLFQTSRLILIGETIKIVIEDYVQHLSGYHFKLKFDPELLFNQQFQYQNRIAAEFNTLYHWHPLLPDTFQIDDQEYSYQQFLYNNSLLMEHGITQFVESFSKQNAGRVAGGRNLPAAVRKVAKASIEHSRHMKYQPLNEYRKRFRMKPYESFEELTGEKEREGNGCELEELYGDIDAMELYPALLVEEPRPDSIFGETMVELGAPFSLKGLMGNPICSPHYWKPSTFGGEVGFKIINTASIQSLICNNVKGCPSTSFSVGDPKPTKTVTMNANPSHSGLEDINPTVLLKGRSAEL
ncbi:hypothetical protein QTO34_011492 [Cnephaeus nilssonii]|uniref:Prostaglandin G/H synthase 2 n=1 Tax=Cnephaeus nilssonii TaxID=3371016 RepID=A0AA40LDF0_CNENI|nr:hypothetical protein QTO34_011492 [Eptesicus nilssonii]